MLNTITQNKWKLYTLYWAGYALLFGLIQGVADGSVHTAVVNELISLPPKVVFVFLVVEWMMQRLFFAKKYARFFVTYLALLTGFAFVQRLIDNYIILRFLLTDWTEESLFSTLPFIYNIVKLQFVVAMPFAFRLYQNWMEERQRAQAIEAQRVQAELASLQNQFQPHFMFNVLNSLYSKILSKSEDAPEMLLRISALLRFSVYEAGGRQIPLAKEIDYLREYVGLQKLRYGNAVDVCFDLSGDPEGLVLEPFLLLPFIENSFKFCFNESEKKGWVTIFLSVQDSRLQLQVENSFSKDGASSISVDKDHGFGMEHVRKRLALLYPNRHTLKTSEGEGYYSVSIKIDLHAKEHHQLSHY